MPDETIINEVTFSPPGLNKMKLKMSMIPNEVLSRRGSRGDASHSCTKLFLLYLDEIKGKGLLSCIIE